MAKPRKVAIVGAGIAGLATAIALARDGFDITVFEQAGKIEEVGAGLQIGPNAAAALEMIGAWDAVAPVTFAPDNVVIRDGRSGQVVKRIPLDRSFAARFGKPYRVALRADLLNALLAVAGNFDNLAISTGEQVTGFDHDPAPALTFAGRKPEAADVVIGADGINSTLRRQLVPSAIIREAGHTIYRSLLPVARAPAATNFDDVTLWMCPHGHVVHYVVPGARLNVVAIHRTAGALSGWSTRATTAEVCGLFARCSGELVDVLQCVPDWLKWAGRDLPGLGGDLTGNVTLAGDAAHASLPYLAQGAAMALEDAAELSRFITGGSRDFGTALRKFEQSRRPRTTRIIEHSRRNGQIYHMSGAAALARNAVLKAMPAGALQKRLAWIYDWPQA